MFLWCISLGTVCMFQCIYAFPDVAFIFKHSNKDLVHESKLRVIVGTNGAHMRATLELFGQQQCVGSELYLTEEAHQTHNHGPP